MYILQDGMKRAYERHLREEEKTDTTIRKYMCDIQKFYEFVGLKTSITKELVIAFKQSVAENYKTTSANSMLVALNRFFQFLGWNDLRVRLFKMQQTCFRSKDKELTKDEYQRLLNAARCTKNERLYYLLQSICSTGIRVSEHKFITVESLKTGVVTIKNKGKQRTILLPKELCKMLCGYCKRKKICSGAVFITRTGKPMDRSNIWSEMKLLCDGANVSSEKVFPHNLRHLFAVTYYRLQKDIVRLADILGHATMDTTRIYTFTSGADHVKTLSKMNLLKQTSFIT